MSKRAGILLPLFSVPGNQGIGDLGQKTLTMIDTIVDAGYGIWAMLPLSPNNHDNCPYNAISSYAGDPIYINIDRLSEMGLLTQSSIVNCNKFKDYVDYDAVRAFKKPYLQRAFKAFRKHYSEYKEEFQAFKKEAFWLNSWTSYELFRENYDGNGWSEWEDEYRFWPERQEVNLRDQVEQVFYIQFLQYIFYKQLKEVTDYAHKKGLKLMMDVPFYVELDNAEVWSFKKNFQLDEKGNVTGWAGVAPESDGVFKEGQVWDKPLYDLEYLDKTDYKLLRDRVKWQSKFFDIVRILHFKAIESYWEVPANRNPEEGQVVLGCGSRLLELLKEDNPDLEIIAEDLGTKRPSLVEMQKNMEIPGTEILQPNLETKTLKHPVGSDLVLYTSCYDTRTVEEDYNTFTNNKRIALRRFFKKRGYEHRAFHELTCHFAIDSPANLVMLNMADVCGLKGQAHLSHLMEEDDDNDNWTWKLKDFKTFPAQLKKTTSWLENAQRIAGAEEES